MHRSLGNTHHPNFPPMPGRAWDLPGLILPPGTHGWQWGCSPGLRLQDRALVPGEEAAPWSREPQLGSCASCLLPHTHKCAARGTQARQRPETQHGNPAESVRLTTFSTRTGYPKPALRDPPHPEPGRPAAAPGPGSGIAARRAARHRAHRGRTRSPAAAVYFKASPMALRQQLRGTRATVLPGLGGCGGGKETSRRGYGGAPVFSLLERTFARGERIWQRESLSLQEKRLALS